MSKKHIMNAGICCICTAVIFGLHFFVYGRMLLTILCWLALPALFLLHQPQGVQARNENHGFRLIISLHGFVS